MNGGSILMMGLQGESLNHEEKKVIEKHGISGVILFERNCHDEQGVIHLCRELKSLKTKTPLLIAIDQEGGRVNRLKNIQKFSHLPSASYLSSHLNLKEIRKLSLALHQNLKSLGINMNLAPCLDISNDQSFVLKERTFSKNPIQTNFMGQAWIQGAKASKVLSCAKHFPGHGGVKDDSHKTLPVDPRSFKAISDSILPFRGAISSKVEAIMMSHILYPNLDPCFISSISKKIIYDLLRKRLNFKGLILSDDLDMKAVKKYSLPFLTSHFIQSGGHLMICGQGLNKVLEILEFLKSEPSIQRCLLQRIKEISQFKQAYIGFL